MDVEDFKAEQSSFKLESIDMNGLLSMRSIEEKSVVKSVPDQSDEDLQEMNSEISGFGLTQIREKPKIDASSLPQKPIDNQTFQQYDYKEHRPSKVT